MCVWVVLHGVNCVSALGTFRLCIIADATKHTMQQENGNCGLDSCISQWPGVATKHPSPLDNTQLHVVSAGPLKKRKAEARLAFLHACSGCCGDAMVCEQSKNVALAAESVTCEVGRKEALLKQQPRLSSILLLLLLKF